MERLKWAMLNVFCFFFARARAVCIGIYVHRVNPKECAERMFYNSTIQPQ